MGTFSLQSQHSYHAPFDSSVHRASQSRSCYYEGQDSPVPGCVAIVTGASLGESRIRKLVSSKCCAGFLPLLGGSSHKAARQGAGHTKFGRRVKTPESPCGLWSYPFTLCANGVTAQLEADVETPSPRLKVFPTIIPLSGRTLSKVLPYAGERFICFCGAPSCSFERYCWPNSTFITECTAS